jgi:hypothetical protein
MMHDDGHWRATPLLMILRWLLKHAMTQFLVFAGVVLHVLGPGGVRVRV